MKKIKIMTTCLISFLLILPFLGFIQLPIANIAINNDFTLNINADDYVDINGDGGFSGYPGYGNSTHPYIIEDLIIIGNQTQPCISIQNTNAHFIIQNCNVSNGTNGIYLSNVQNAQLINNTAYNNNGTTVNTGNGFFLNNVDHSKLMNNSAYNNRGNTGGPAYGYHPGIL